MDKLNLINIFLAVCHSGSFVAAATQLGLNPSTVSKAISQLEKYLELKLFNRTTRTLQLTASGNIYRENCHHLLAGLNQCEQKLISDHNEPKGLLKVNLPVAYGQLYIMPMLSRFCERYPKVKLEVSLTDDYIDMIGHSIDIAIRSGQMQDSRLVAKKLSPMHFAIAASPAFLKNNKQITAANIQKLPWILYRFIHTGQIMPIIGTKKSSHKKEHYEFMPEPVLVTTDGLSMVTACKGGVGLMQAPHFLLRDALNAGKIKLVQPYFNHEKFSIYAYYSDRGYVPEKVRVFIDFIVQELAVMGESYDSTYLSSLA